MFNHYSIDFLPKETYVPSHGENMSCDSPTEQQEKATDLERLIKSHVSAPEPDDVSAKRMTITEILIRLGLNNPSKSDLNKASKIMRSIGIVTIKSNGLTHRIVNLF